MTEQFKLAATDGKDIHGHVWTPGGEARLVVQLLHGMGEYAGRYVTFGNELSAADFAVVAHDFRGHGPNAELRGHYADKEGWRLNLDDCRIVNEFAREQFPGKPLVLMGHSMGSFFAQNYAMDHSLDGLILSASTWPNKPLIYPGLALAKIESLRLGRRGKSALLDKMGFGDFNKPYQPARTDYDWLSRDDAQVDKYVEDTGNQVTLNATPFNGMLEKSRNAVQASESEFDIPPCAVQRIELLCQLLGGGRLIGQQAFDAQ